MAYEQRDNSGSLFKNDRKTESKHADYRGEAIINGVSYWVSSWVKEGKSGKFMSLAFKVKEDKKPGGNPPKSNSEMPF